MNTSYRKRIAFVINPIAGGKNKKQLIHSIQENFSKYNYELINWAYPEQKTEIIDHLKKNNYDVVVAVGGDGTINQVAQAIINTDTLLGIIPMGSGNGLARHLKIPLNIYKALYLIKDAHNTIKIDSCMVNGIDFFCTSGVGFDAYIGSLFAQSKTRGFFSYSKLTLSSLISYKPKKYKINIDGRLLEKEAFLITFANASQYGNNAYIAPLANIQDGLIDMVILKPFKLWNMLNLAYRMFNKTIHHSNFLETYKAKNILIEQAANISIHFDGEPMLVQEKHITVKIKPSSLKVIVP